MNPKIWVVIPAAGQGSRMGATVPKQYLKLANRSVLEHSLSHFLSRSDISGVVVALAVDDSFWSGLCFAGKDTIHQAVGGVDRSTSVLNALRYLSTTAEFNDWVLVHDAARPCLRRSDLDNLISTFQQDPVGGLLAVPLRDTLKHVTGTVVDRTVDRDGLWLAQTPQMFRLGALVDALEQAQAKGLQVTDEASAMEFAGYLPRIVPGHSDNLKITHAEDLALAEKLIGQSLP